MSDFCRTVAVIAWPVKSFEIVNGFINAIIHGSKARLPCEAVQLTEENFVTMTKWYPPIFELKQANVGDWVAISCSREHGTIVPKERFDTVFQKREVNYA